MEIVATVLKEPAGMLKQASPAPYLPTLAIRKPEEHFGVFRFELPHFVGHGHRR